MSAPRILLHHDATARLAARLAEACPEAELHCCNSYADLPGALAHFRPDIVYAVRFAGSKGYPRAALLGPDGPRWVAVGGAGTDHLGLWETERFIVTNSAGVAAEMMAEYVFGGFLHFTLDVPGLQNDQAARAWNTRKMLRLRGKTLLILGLGHTGQAIARLGRAFGMHVIGTRARPEPMEAVDEVHAPGALPDLIARADFIAVSVPLIPATRGLLDADAFAAVKPGVILADVSRGAVIDQSALLNALRDGRIAGAALDVFETEPLPPDNPLWSEPHVLISPHCSSVYAGWEEASFEFFLANLARWCSGEPLLNQVDPARGY